jgi:cytochrome c5
MDWISRFKAGWRAAAGLGAGLLVCLTLGACSTATKAKAPGAVTQSSAPVPAKLQFTGAELYSMNCNRCHAERYPTERTAAQWKTILLHMRVRANLPADQAEIILRYLQENSGR